MIISTEAEEAFVKIINPFMISKSLRKLEITKGAQRQKHSQYLLNAKPLEDFLQD